jgi:dTDP-4-dehydrorhamnose reductase
MRSIREVNPAAQLIQTEDLGKTYATPVLQYQARFENERRWLTFDLLAGRVVGQHPMAAYLRWAGVGDDELEALAEGACPPDVIGINHYLTSERFLDHRIKRYPRHAWGGNERHRYADVEAVRVLSEGVAGPYELLREAWQRYKRPLAVTEVQLACTREQQLRWLDEVWTAAMRLRAEDGADVRAVTAWSAFGAHDWSSLLTRSDGHYEPGIFDVRAPEPRPTAVATMVRSLAECGFFDHAALGAPGWWRCDHRLIYPPENASMLLRSVLRRRHDVARGVRRRGSAPPVLIVGARGTLGQAVARACGARGLASVALSRGELDATDERAVWRVFATMRPWCVVNCAGFVRVDDAEREQAACRAANVDSATVLARACASFGAKLVTFSTDLVFDGTKRMPYVESDATGPLCEYGRTKAIAESAVMAATDEALIVRTAAFFGDHDDYNFVTQVLRTLASGLEFKAVSDVVVSPTYVPDLVDTVLDLAIDGESGLWHLASDGALTWEELAREAARAADINADRLVGVSLDDLGLAAERPHYSALTSERAALMAPVDDALARYARGRPWERTPLAAVASASGPNGHRITGGPSNSFNSSTRAHGRTRYEGMAGAGDGS